MGLFDTFLTEEYENQVKCFYRPIYYRSMDEIMHSGGTMDVFRVGDEVPLETPYYRYPKDFYIFDPDDEYEISVIKDGKFWGFLKTISDLIQFFPTYTRHGRKLKAESIEDLIRFKKEEKEEMEKPTGERNFITFYERWTEETLPEHELGELMDCYFFTKSMALVEMPETLKAHMDYNADTEELKKKINQFKADRPEVFDDFVRKYEVEWTEK